MNKQNKELLRLPTRPPFPLVFARSALFSVSSRSRHINGELLPCAPTRESSIFYVGPQLTQKHSFLWQAVIQRATDLEIENDSAFSISASSINKSLGIMQTDTRMRRRIRELLHEMTSARIKINTRCSKFDGPLLKAVGRQTGTGRLGIRLDPDLMSFLNNEIAHNHLNRKALFKSNPVAAWLHDYISSHLDVPAERLAVLHAWSGAHIPLATFRRHVKISMDLLRTGPKPLVLSWSITHADRLIVEKTNTRVILSKGGAPQGFVSDANRLVL